MLARLKTGLRNLFREETVRQIETWGEAQRSRPLQFLDADYYLNVPMPDFQGDLVHYAMSPWMAIAVTRMSEMAMMAAPLVRQRSDKTTEVRDHALLDLVGLYGQPNDYQDSLELREVHFQHLDAFGNSFWYWSSRFGGAPDEVYLLDPQRMRIVPGSRRTIDHYLYVHGGREFPISPIEITHFRRGSVLSGGGYFGRTPAMWLRLDIQNDRQMALWNNQFFTSGVPSGILVVPASLTDEQVRRMSDDLELQHSERRRVAVVRAEPGSAVWYDAGLKQRELEFADGRKQIRQAVWDMMGFHVGLTSEASTEAHARVAERRVLHSVYTRLVRTASRLTTSDVLNFWPGGDRYLVSFEDVRQADWEQEAMKLKAIGAYLTVDEVRQREFSLGPVEKGVFENGGSGKNQGVVDRDRVSD